jgi:hypothetical protein
VNTPYRARPPQPRIPWQLPSCLIPSTPTRERVRSIGRYLDRYGRGLGVLAWLGLAGTFVAAVGTVGAFMLGDWVMTHLGMPLQADTVGALDGNAGMGRWSVGFFIMSSTWWLPKLGDWWFKSPAPKRPFGYGDPPGNVTPTVTVVPCPSQGALTACTHSPSPASASPTAS